MELSSTSIGDIATTLAFFLALCGAARALWEFSKKLQEVKYSELDRLYFDLQRAALDYPEATAPPPADGDDPRSPADQKRYQVYAGMVWNFLETVEDRCRRDESLKLTWYPVLLVEKERHMAWMRDRDNARLFKATFRDRHCPDHTEAAGDPSPARRAAAAPAGLAPQPSLRSR